MILKLQNKTTITMQIECFTLHHFAYIYKYLQIVIFEILFYKLLLYFIGKIFLL
jgi:hypothetical protein